MAVGMAYIFSKIPWMEQLMAYWYHFAIMFEAVFILSAVDAGTRVGRFFYRKMMGKRFIQSLRTRIGFRTDFPHLSFLQEHGDIWFTQGDITNLASVRYF